VVDPAHVTVSHHNVVGNRYDNQVMRLDVTEPLTKHGFSMRNPSSANPVGGLTTFYAPSLVAIDANVGDDGAKQVLELYVSPSRPGFCNHVGRMVIVKDKSGAMPKLFRQFTLPIPKWLNHVATSAFFNQDGLFLHHQERSMAATGQYSSLLKDGEKAYEYNKAIYPVNSDKGVLLFRNWIRQLAGGRIPYLNNPVMPPASNNVVFDVWNGHTKYCRYCQDALRRLQRVRFASLTAAACLAVVRPLGVVGNLVSTLGLAGLGLLVNKLIGMFYRYEFSHAHND
jgi:Pheophorbide a oxygenase